MIEESKDLLKCFKCDNEDCPSKQEPEGMLPLPSPPRDCPSDEEVSEDTDYD